MSVIVQNRYFVRAGFREQALGVRRRANHARANANRPVGQILVTLDPGPDAPDFIWECAYPDLEARNEDLAWADSSAEFVEIQHQMGELLDRFERHLFEVLDDNTD
ncbi:MAG: hypothetical protein ACOC9Y_07585 [Chloroflexota bacterium]